MVDQAAQRSTSLAILTEIAARSRGTVDCREAIAGTLEPICAGLGWPVGHAYLVSADEAGSSRVWFVAHPARYETLRTVTESLRFRPGEGLVGGVLDEERTAWVADLESDQTFARAHTALAAGLRSGVAVPVFAAGRVACVLEFFSERAGPPADEVVDLLAVAAAELSAALERAHGDEAVEEQLSRYQRLFESTSDAILVGGPDGTITDVNPAACRLLGYSREELLGRNARELCAPEWVELASMHAARGLTGQLDEASHQMALLDRAGNRISVEARTHALRKDGKAVGLHAVLRDGRERKRVERALRESEERFRGAFERSPIGMAFVAPDGRWLKVNDALCRIVGYTAEELLTKRWQDITHPDDLAADLALVQQMLDGEIASYELEKRYLHRDGRIVWIHLGVTLVRDASCEPAYLISQIQDISERKRAQSAAAQRAAASATAGALSPREREVMSLLAEGHTSAEAARALGVSEDTVQTHVRRSMAKLDARSRTHAVAIALRLGMLADPAVDGAGEAGRNRQVA